jgi:hypothetical protein
LSCCRHGAGRIATISRFDETAERVALFFNHSLADQEVSLGEI